MQICCVRFGERSHFPFCSTYISGFILLRTDRYGWVALLLCARTAWVCADGMLCGHDCCCAAVADFRCVEEMSDHGIFSIRDIPACAGSRCLLYGVLFCYRQSEACISERNRVIEDGVCHRAWNCICGINSKTMVSSKLLEE